MAAIPLLTPLPDPPLPTDAEAVFDAKAGASLTAQQTFVNVDMNTKVIPGINQAVTDATTAKNAASQSASDAAGSASAASSSVTAASDQVALAQTARQGAEVAAAAASTAAGLPGGNNGLAVMQAICLSF